MKQEFPGYEKALSELNSILAKIESGEVDIDQLSELVKRASFLLDTCQQKLREVDTDLKNTLEEENGENE